jgi:SnoaL-like protein
MPADSLKGANAMPTDQTKRKELWGRWVAALCARDLRRAEEVAEEMCDQDYIVHNPKLPDYGRGPAAAKAFAHYVITHYSQIDLMLEDFFGEGDKTAARSTVRFTVTATGQKVSYPVLNIMRWVGDKLAERWELSGQPEEQA